MEKIGSYDDTTKTRTSLQNRQNYKMKNLIGWQATRKPTAAIEEILDDLPRAGHSLHVTTSQILHISGLYLLKCMGTEVTILTQWFVKDYILSIINKWLNVGEYLQDMLGLVNAHKKCKQSFALEVNNTKRSSLSC